MSVKYVYEVFFSIDRHKSAVINEKAVQLLHLFFNNLVKFFNNSTDIKQTGGIKI